MQIIKIASQSQNDNDFKKMKDWFEVRTNKHCDLVSKYCKKIVEYDESKYGLLLDRIKKHDASKFKEPELEPYIYITWKYKCQSDNIDWEPPKEMDKKMDIATEHHILHNRHHPEYHCGRKTNLINKEKRDQPPSEIIDATKMTNVDIAEMVADWLSVGEERNTKTIDWADNNINIRWKFTSKQSALIYELIEAVESS